MKGESKMLIEIPGDVKQFLIDVQADKKKEKRTGFYSLAQSVILCLQELMLLKGFQVTPEKQEKDA